MPAWIDHQPAVTEAIKGVLAENYNYDSTVRLNFLRRTAIDVLTSAARKITFYALYRSFTECIFIEDEGSIVFYKNRYGVASRQLAEDASSALQGAAGLGREAN